MNHAASEQQPENSFQPAINTAAANHCSKSKGGIEKQDSCRGQVCLQRCALDVERDGPLRTEVDAFAAFAAGKQRFSCLQAFFIDAERRALPQAQLAVHTGSPVDPHCKNIYFIENRLKGAERAEQTALDSPSGQDRQNDDQGDEQGAENHRLQRRFY